MDRLNPLNIIQTPKNKEKFEGLEEGEDHLEQPLSPIARFFHEPGPNLYILTIIGMKTLIDPDLFKSYLLQVVGKNRRFSSLQVLDKENGIMKWVPTHVNVDDHVIVPELDPNMEYSSDKFLEDYISNLSRSPIKNSKPLWDLHILNVKISDVQGTCVFRFHHSLGDGLSLMNLLLAYSRKASDPSALPTLPSGDKSSRRQTKVTRFRSIFIVFWNTLVALVMFLLTLLFLEDTSTPLKGSSDGENKPRRFARTTVNLNDIKMVKKAMNATVNDVIVGVIEAGLYRYLDRRYGENNDSVPKNIRLRAILFFNLRASTHVDVFANKTSTKQETWGNKLGCVVLPFNMKPRQNVLDYVREVKTVMKSKKASLEPFFAPLLSKLHVKLFGFKSAVKSVRRFNSRTTLWFSNMPGPREEILFCGHEVDNITISCYGQPSALLIHVVSYAEKVTFMVSVNEETIPDPHELCDDLQQSLYLMTSVLPTTCVKN